MLQKKTLLINVTVYLFLSLSYDFSFGFFYRGYTFTPKFA